MVVLRRQHMLHTAAVEGWSNQTRRSTTRGWQHHVGRATYGTRGKEASRLCRH